MSFAIYDHTRRDFGIECYQCHEGGELIDCRYTDDCDHRVCADCVKRCPICNMEVCEECQKRTFTNGICDACYESMPEDLVLLFCS